MRQFLDIIKENKIIREKMEELLEHAYQEFVIARAVMNSPMLEEAMMSGNEPINLEIDTKNIMSVEVPIFEAFSTKSLSMDSVPYGMASTSGELDVALSSYIEVFPLMLNLAQIEKTAQLLSDEIEKTRRRVNSLEYVMIPNYEETIRSITMKLDESERGNLTRLMKVKDMIVKQAVEAARVADQAN